MCTYIICSDGLESQSLARHTFSHSDPVDILHLVVSCLMLIGSQSCIAFTVTSGSSSLHLVFPKLLIMASNLFLICSL